MGNLRQEYKQLDEHYESKRRNSDKIWMILDRDGLTIGVIFVALAIIGSTIKWMFKGIKKADHS